MNTNTIPLEQHIEELRLELRYCRMTRRERAEVEADLVQAEAELQARYRQLEWA
ncbi:MAG TPA: hypothetical protein VHY35_05420 [Stellaceae bacterium]|jgi:ABC-type phosphate transport system auxiliary subunit|nr:hypothetical protein [Stellaceae bacterium]